MNQTHRLRPLERRVVQLVEAGVGASEIGRRFRRSPEMINRIVDMAALPGRIAGAVAQNDELRPLERRVLRWRDGGADYSEIGTRFGRSAAHVERVEALARFKSTRA
jgi:DNA-binding CsgD family transcriptional regulator